MWGSVWGPQEPRRGEVVLHAVAPVCPQLGAGGLQPVFPGTPALLPTARSESAAAELSWASDPTCAKGGPYEL